jgi:hypothetical protein
MNSKNGFASAGVCLLLAVGIVAVAAIALFSVADKPVDINAYLSTLALALACLVLTAIAVAIVIMLLRGLDADTFANFLFEPNVKGTGERGKPSVSRLQMLIWNFVVAFAFLYVLGKDGAGSAIDTLLTTEVLVLLGISNGTYYLSKSTKPGTERGEAPANGSKFKR